MRLYSKTPALKSTVSVGGTLIFSWGNPSRGDDAIGPYITDNLSKKCFNHIEILTDFQLQIEHVLDLDHRDRVLFIDASFTASPPFDFYRLKAARDDSYTSHAMSPQSLLAVYDQLRQGTAPASFMLSVAALNFELGTAISTQAMLHLNAAVAFVENQLLPKDLQHWKQLAGSA